MCGASGVAPPALPPQQAAGSEDEEGMDEPPEVRDFLQELGEGGGRPAGGDDAASGVLPTVGRQIFVCMFLILKHIHLGLKSCV